MLFFSPKQEAPFAFLKKSPGPDGRPLEGNARFEGFSVDLIDALAERLEFTYELYPVPDGKFGEVMENGEWNGVIGEILNGVNYAHWTHDIIITSL